MHRQLRLHRRRAAACTSGTPRTAPAAARPPTPTAATTRSVALGTPVTFVKGMIAGHPGHHRRPREARLQLLDRHAPARHSTAARPAPTTTSRWCGSRPGRCGTSTRRCRSGVARAGSAPGSLAAGGRVYTYGNSGLRGGAEPLAPKTGASLGQSGGGWTHDAYTVTPGHPGRLRLAASWTRRGARSACCPRSRWPRCPASNGLGDLYREVRYAQKHSGIAGLRLVAGDEEVRPRSSEGRAGVDFRACGTGRDRSRRSSSPP